MNTQEYKEFIGNPMHFNKAELTVEEAIHIAQKNIKKLKESGCYHSRYTAFYLEGNVFAWGAKYQKLWKEVKSLASQYPSIEWDIQDFYHWSEWELKEMDWVGNTYRVVEIDL